MMGLLDNIEKLKGWIGLYALFNYHDICVYVGKADCLHSRLKTHLNKRDDIRQIEIVDLRKQTESMDYESTKAYLRFKESQYIQEMEPLENVMRPAITPEYFHSLPLGAASEIIKEIN